MYTVTELSPVCLGVIWTHILATPSRKKISNYGYQDVLDTGIHTNPMPCVGFGKWTGVDTNVP